jgi:hypothetical protein
MNIIRLIISAVLFFSSYNVFSQEVTIKTELDTNKIEIGDQVSLTYTINKNNSDVIILPQFSDTLIIDVEILQPPIVDSVVQRNNRTQIKQKLVITSFEEGKHFIPPQPFTLITAERSDTIMSAASYIDVVGVAIDTTNEIRNIAGVEKAPIIFRDFLPFIILIALAGLIVLIVYLVRQRKRKKGILPEKEMIAEPAHIIALRELDKLKAQKLWQQDRVKEYYSRLTNIIREYLENRYGILALEKPSSEILQELKTTDIEKCIDMSELRSLLNLADLIKFAKGMAEPQENILHLENAYSFVKSTYSEVVEEIENKETEQLA